MPIMPVMPNMLLRQRLLRGTLLIFALMLAVLLLGGCGTQGYAPPLGKVGHATLAAVGTTQAQATVVLTPFDASHITVYYRGEKLPTTGAETPAQLRQSNCLGSFVAPLTDGNPANLYGIATPTVAAGAPASVNSVNYAPDPAGGMDVAIAPSENLYVLVLAHRDNPSSALAACGNPLSGRNQYFDLYPPQTGSSGIALGTALMTPIVATRLSFTISNAAFHANTWAVHSGSCSGPTVASGTYSNSATPPVVYQASDLNHWWVTLTNTTGIVICGQATA